MTTSTGYIETLPCADEGTHPSHAWGWRKRCPGRVHGVVMMHSKIQSLAALHHDALIQALMEQGLSKKVRWGQLPEASRTARVQAMRQVILDLQQEAK